MFVLVGNICAQTSYHITTGQGLATHQLTVLIKDYQNNMWFGSYNGLHKHEGTSIKVYNKSANNPAALSGNEMHAIFEDRLGYIWAGTTAGLDKLDPRSGMVKHYKIKNLATGDDNIGYIYTIFQGDNDDVWFTTDVGMYVMDYTTGQYKNVASNSKTGKGLPETDMNYKASYATKQGIWMLTQGRLIFFDYRSKQFIHRYNNPQQKKIFNLGGNSGSGTNSDICIDSASNLYFIGHNTFLMKYNLLTEKVDSFRFEMPSKAWRCCYAVSADYKGNIWMGFRYGGILLFNKTSSQFTAIRSQGVNSLIGSDYVYSLCEDYLKRMWVTTNNGVYVINYYDSSVQQQYLNNTKDNSNIDFEASIISQDKTGNIYIPYNAGGLYKYNIYSSQVAHFAVPDTMVKSYAYAYVNRNNKFLIGNNKTLKFADTTGGHIKLQEPQSGFYKTLATKNGRVSWIYEHGEKEVYVKKSWGQIYYSNGINKLEVIDNPGFKKATCLSNDSKYLYILTNSGDILQRNLQSLEMDTIPIAPLMKSMQFSFARPGDLADDGFGNIWITSQNGLVRYNLEKKKLSVYTTADGLLHDFTFALCADSHKRLWVGSMLGVNLYDPAKDNFINVFPESTDRMSDYFGSSLEAKNGHIYFQFGGKLVNINPEAFLNRPFEQRLLKMNEVQVNGITTDTVSGVLSKLGYKQNRIYFRFGLLEFTEPDKIKYAYRLKGVDTAWIEIGNRNDVTFNSLPAGKYTLLVKAKDVYGNEVQQQLAIPFNIQPPYWQTWWFKVILLIVLALLVFWVLQSKIKAIKRKESVKQRMVTLETKALRAQMNPHFIFNAMNSIQQFSMQKDIDNANKYLSKFSKALRMALHQSEHSKIKLSAEIEMLELYLEIEALRFGDSFSYIFEMEEDLETEAIMIPSMIVQPMVENALKHGLSAKKGEKILLIKFELINDNSIRCVVEDNGIGRSKAKQIADSRNELMPHESVGMKLVVERLALLTGNNNGTSKIIVTDLMDEKDQPAGTRVEILMPVN